MGIDTELVPGAQSFSADSVFPVFPDNETSLAKIADFLKYLIPRLALSDPISHKFSSMLRNEV